MYGGRGNKTSAIPFAEDEDGEKKDAADNNADYSANSNGNQQP